MRAFETLGYGGQLRRQRRLAASALSAYAIEPVRLTSLFLSDHTTFRVDASSGRDGCGCKASAATGLDGYVLRIHRPEDLDAVQIRSELLWLAALRRDTGLVVPEPVPARDGSLVTAASAPGVPEARCCVLFRWVSGRFLWRWSAERLRRVGGFMARLHRHAEQFALPDGFVRPLWDKDCSLGHSIEEALQTVEPLISRSDLDVLLAAREQGRRARDALGRDPAVFGLIHADLHPGNLLSCRSEIRAIDFADCGFGHYMYDIAVTLRTVYRRDEDPSLLRAFYDGYRRIRPLPEEHKVHLPALLAQCRLDRMVWDLTIADVPRLGVAADEAGRGCASYLRGVLGL